MCLTRVPSLLPGHLSTCCSKNLFSDRIVLSSQNGNAPVCRGKQKPIWNKNSFLFTETFINFFLFWQEQENLLNGCLTTISRVTFPSFLPSSCWAKRVEGTGASFFATLIGCLSRRKRLLLIGSFGSHCGNRFCKALTWCSGAPEIGSVGNGFLSEKYLLINLRERSRDWSKRRRLT